MHFTASLRCIELPLTDSDIMRLAAWGTVEGDYERMLASVRNAVVLGLVVATGSSLALASIASPASRDDDESGEPSSPVQAAYSILSAAFDAGGGVFYRYVVDYEQAVRDLDRLLKERPLRWIEIARSCESLATSLEDTEELLAVIDFGDFSKQYTDAVELIEKKHRRDTDLLETSRARIEEFHRETAGMDREEMTPVQLSELGKLDVTIRATSARLIALESSDEVLRAMQSAIEARNDAVHDIVVVHSNLAFQYRQIADTIRTTQDLQSLKSMLDLLTTDRRDLTARIEKAREQINLALDLLESSLAPQP